MNSIELSYHIGNIDDVVIKQAESIMDIVKQSRKRNIRIIVGIISIAAIFAIVIGGFTIIMELLTNDEKPSNSMIAGGPGNSDKFTGGIPPEPRLILDAKELLELSIDYTSKIPIHAIINKEPGYEEYYNLLILSATQWLNHDPPHPFQGDAGFYISMTPVYWFDIYEYKMHDIVNVVLLSENLENAAEAIFFLVDNSLNWNGGFTFYPLRLMMQNPDERYIFLFNNIGTFLLDSNNKTHQWTAWGYYTLEVRGDFYNALNHDLLGVSYNDLINPDNLIWIEFNNN